MNDKVKMPPRPYTPESFALSARAYLERFPCSEARFERTMKMKFLKRRQPHEPEWIDAALREGRRLGFLDDNRYGEALLNEYHRQGLPPMRIKQKLQVKQLPSVLITKLIATLPQDTETRRASLDAYARRKRAGPYNPKFAEKRDKDYAKLRRAGFQHDDVIRFFDARD